MLRKTTPQPMKPIRGLIYVSCRNVIRNHKIRAARSVDPLISIRGEMIKQTLWVLKLIRRVEVENLNDVIWKEVSKAFDWSKTQALTMRSSVEKRVSSVTFYIQIKWGVRNAIKMEANWNEIFEMQTLSWWWTVAGAQSLGNFPNKCTSN